MLDIGPRREDDLNATAFLLRPIRREVLAEDILAECVIQCPMFFVFIFILGISIASR